MAMTLECAACSRRHALSELAWRCAGCGGVLDLAGFTATMPGPAVLAGRRPGMWRYAEALPLPEPVAVSLGEGMTPLVTAPGRPDVRLKIDYLMPSGSFKDRGAVLLAALAVRLAPSRLVADSSGNAGAAIAAYAARAGLPCDVYVPAATSAGKVGQLHAYGATVHRIDGSREDTADAAARAVEEPGVLYASHVHNPFFLHGTKTYVLELFEQLGGRLPDTLVLPVGNGTLVLGAHLGARELLAQGLVPRLPRIVAVQAAACAPLAAAFRLGLAVPGPDGGTDGGGTIAEGIAIARPARGAQILAAVRDTTGEIVTVTDDEVRVAQTALARAGLYVEPTSAVCWAAVTAGLAGTAAPAPGPDGPDAGVAGAEAGAGPRLVVPLCGTGLKSRPPDAVRRPPGRVAPSRTG